MKTVNIYRNDTPNEVAFTYDYDTDRYCVCTCGHMVTMHENENEVHCTRCGKRYVRECNDIFPADKLFLLYHDEDEYDD